MLDKNCYILDEISDDDSVVIPTSSRQHQEQHPGGVEPGKTTSELSVGSGSTDDDVVVTTSRQSNTKTPSGVGIPIKGFRIPRSTLSTFLVIQQFGGYVRINRKNNRSGLFIQVETDFLEWFLILDIKIIKILDIKIII